VHQLAAPRRKRPDHGNGVYGTEVWALEAAELREPYFELQRLPSFMREPLRGLTVGEVGRMINGMSDLAGRLPGHAPIQDGIHLRLLLGA
jgi:hypothetical protein